MNASASYKMDSIGYESIQDILSEVSEQHTKVAHTVWKSKTSSADDDFIDSEALIQNIFSPSTSHLPTTTISKPLVLTNNTNTRKEQYNFTSSGSGIRRRAHAEEYKRKQSDIDALTTHLKLPIFPGYKEETYRCSEQNVQPSTINTTAVVKQRTSQTRVSKEVKPQHSLLYSSSKRKVISTKLLQKQAGNMNRQKPKNLSNPQRHNSKIRCSQETVTNSIKSNVSQIRIVPSDRSIYNEKNLNRQNNCDNNRDLYTVVSVSKKERVSEEVEDKSPKKEANIKLVDRSVKKTLPILDGKKSELINMKHAASIVKMRELSSNRQQQQSLHSCETISPQGIMTVEACSNNTEETSDTGKINIASNRTVKKIDEWIDDNMKILGIVPGETLSENEEKDVLEENDRFMEYLNYNDESDNEDKEENSCETSLQSSDVNHCCDKNSLLLSIIDKIVETQRCLECDSSYEDESERYTRNEQNSSSENDDILDDKREEEIPSTSILVKNQREEEHVVLRLNPGTNDRIPECSQRSNICSSSSEGNCSCISSQKSSRSLPPSPPSSTFSSSSSTHTTNIKPSNEEMSENDGQNYSSYESDDFESIAKSPETYIGSERYVHYDDKTKDSNEDNRYPSEGAENSSYIKMNGESSPPCVKRRKDESSIISDCNDKNMEIITDEEEIRCNIVNQTAKKVEVLKQELEKVKSEFLKTLDEQKYRSESISRDSIPIEREKFSQNEYKNNNLNLLSDMDNQDLDYIGEQITTFSLSPTTESCTSYLNHFDEENSIITLETQTTSDSIFMLYTKNGRRNYRLLQPPAKNFNSYLTSQHKI